jgi:hypothetical protein
MMCDGLAYGIYACVCTYSVVMGSSSYCVVYSCYECLLSWVDSLLYKVCVLLSSVLVMLRILGYKCQYVRHSCVACLY